MSFGHRAPAPLRFAAYSAAIMDLAIGTALIVIGSQQGTFALQVAGLLLAATFWVAPWLLLGVRYEIAGGDLIVRRGPVERRIPLAEIEETRSVPQGTGVDAVQVRFRRGESHEVATLQPDDPAEMLRRIAMEARQLAPASEGVLRRSGG